MSVCNWCWGRDHNAATCPEKKKYIKERPDSYEAARESVKLKRREAREKTPRKCGFCRHTGHNVSTCYTKRTIQKNYKALNSVYRGKVLEEMRIMGLGAGALVNFKPRTREREPIVALVKSVKWNRIYAASDGASYSLELERAMDPPEDHFAHLSPHRRRSLGSRHLAHTLTRPMMGEIYQREDVWERHLHAGGAEIEVISPINATHINPPSNWLNGDLCDTSDNENPFKYQGKNAALWNLDYEMHHFAYFAETLGLKEIHRYFESFYE